MFKVMDSSDVDSHLIRGSLDSGNTWHRLG